MDEVVGVGHLAGLIECFLCVVFEPVGDVFLDSPRKKDGFLRNNSDLLVVPAGVELLYVNPVEEDLARVGVVVALDHRDDA